MWFVIGIRDTKRHTKTSTVVYVPKRFVDDVKDAGGRGSCAAHALSNDVCAGYVSAARTRTFLREEPSPPSPEAERKADKLWAYKKPMSAEVHNRYLPAVIGFWLLFPIEWLFTWNLVLLGTIDHSVTKAVAITFHSLNFQSCAFHHN